MFHTGWVPQCGVSVNPGHGFNIKASLSKGYRNPSFRELYLYAMANPDLEPESMMNYEVSLSHRFGTGATASLTAYYCNGDNMIQTLDMKNQKHRPIYQQRHRGSLAGSLSSLCRSRPPTAICTHHSTTSPARHATNII